MSRVTVFSSIFARTLFGKPKWSSSSMEAVFLKNSKSTFVSFRKIRTKILDVDNVELYQCAKYQFKIRCILGTQK
jgi:hypothetical protein